ncbi:MAG: hypothetical protein K2H83_00285 [Duncaniella sp.]|nr:hypothetical protein [Duncaniella sp.]
MNEFSAVIQLITTNLNVDKFIEICFNALLVVQKVILAQRYSEMHNQLWKRITLYLRTTKTSGKIKLRFRLIEGREVQLFHKSQIDADLADLKKFEMDGSLKPRVSIYNEKLRIAITREIEAMREAYNLLKDEGRVFDANDFEERIDKILNPENRYFR